MEADHVAGFFSCPTYVRGSVLLDGNRGIGACTPQARKPPVGGILSVEAVPSELRIWFSERVEPFLSEIQVVNAAERE